LDSSRDAAVATNPARLALTAEILKMLPEPRELVCFFWLSLILLYLFQSFFLAQNEMFPLYDCQDFRGVYGL
jgi:hypothetical protein